MKLVLTVILLCLNTVAFFPKTGTWMRLETEIYQYTSLEEALAAPRDSVYSLKLKDRLREVPPEVFTAFPNLQWLDLSKNRLKEIPATLGLVKKP